MESLLGEESDLECKMKFNAIGGVSLRIKHMFELWRNWKWQDTRRKTAQMALRSLNPSGHTTEQPGNGGQGKEEDTFLTSIA